MKTNEEEIEAIVERTTLMVYVRQLQQTIDKTVELCNNTQAAMSITTNGAMQGLTKTPSYKVTLTMAENR